MAAVLGVNFGIFVSDDPGANNWDVWMNPSLLRLDTLIFLDVIQRSLNTPPGGPSVGDRYHLGASPTGAWSGHAGEIAGYFDGAWTFFIPKEGWLMTAQTDAGVIFKYQSGSFVSITSGISLADYKESVVVATTANITLSGEQTIDGVLTSASRVLVKNQSTGANNGIYVSAAGSWTRATDFDVDAEVTGGAIIPVSRGTLNGNGLWMLTTDDPITLGSTALVFAQTFATATLDNLSDVVITSPATKQNLEYNGSNWVNQYRFWSLCIACGDESTAITASGGKVEFQLPHAVTLTEVFATLTTAQAANGGGGIFTVDINEAGTTILSTKITIDNTEKTSRTAATPPVISDANLANNGVMTVDVDQIGDGSAKGLKVWLIGREAA